MLKQGKERTHHLNNPGEMAQMKKLVAGGGTEKETSIRDGFEY